MKNAFSGAMVVIINIIILYVIKENNLFGFVIDDIKIDMESALGTIKTSEFTTMLIFSTTITGMFMLWKMIMPPTAYRMILMLLMTALIILIAYFGATILGIGEVQRENTMLLIILLACSYPLIAFFNNLLSKIHLDRVPLLNKLGNAVDR
jgi:hypothetical protein